MTSASISRRDFIKLAALGAGSLALRPIERLSPLSRPAALPDFPPGERLGRLTATIESRARPDPESAPVKTLYEDTVVPWLKEWAGQKLDFNRFVGQRWVETPEGFIYGPYLQPVENRPNQPVEDLNSTSLGRGMWAEVTVPYVDVALENEPSANSWVRAKVDEGSPVRLYYSQMFWIDQARKDDQGKVFYRVNPNYYGGIDMLWAAAEAFRPITAEELEPIHPEAENKRIVVDVTHQSLSCFEDDSEVYYCRVSTGAKFNMYGEIVDKWETPVGKHETTRKFISLQMSGGTTGAGYDLPGIGWTMIFATGGVAIHSTFWHNNFGDRMSHGCVNVCPADSKWIFRWTQPVVAYDPGMVDITVNDTRGTRVDVVEY